MILDVRLNIQTANSQVNSEGEHEADENGGKICSVAKTDKFFLFDYVFVL
jgi:hypothetical protein